MSGPPKFGWLRILKNSARYCRRKRSLIGKFFKTEKSRFRSGGAITTLRPALPWNPGVGSANEVGSYQWFTVWLSMLPKPGFTALTRCGTYDPQLHTFVPVGVSGNPLSKLAML